MFYAAFPPEINSGRIYSGPGSGPLVSAAIAWDELATELQSTAASYSSVISSLTSGTWSGPTSLSMAAAVGPYLAWMRETAAQAAEIDPQPAPDEVVAVYRVGLHQLQRADSPRFITIPESPRPVVQIPLGNDLIHAPTGAVLLQLRWLGLEGRHDPVDELEQPVFAWR